MALLQYDFSVVNQNLLSQVLASNERRIAQHNARISRMTGTPVSGRARASGAAVAKTETTAAMALDRQRAAALFQLHRAAERERLKGERAVAREGMRLDRERSAAAKALDRQRASALAAQVRAAERAGAGVLRERRAVAGAVTGRIGRSLTGTLGGVGAIAAGALGIGGSVAIGSALQTQMSESARASQLANQAGRPEIKGELLREAQGLRGFTGAEALEGLGAFVDVTGDLDSARGMLSSMGDVALATSTNLGELAGAMGAAFIPLADQIKDPAERLKKLNEVMRATAGMGAVGAVEVKDLAKEMAGLAATSAKFKGNSETNLKTMVAFAQAARQRGGAASAAEAVTSVERFGSDVVTKSDALAKMGVDVFSDKTKTQLKDPTEILVEVLQRTQGDLTKLGDVFSERSIRAVQGFSPLFATAEAANAALPEGQRRARGAAGTEAVRAEMARLMKASVTEDQVAARVASRMEDPDLQFKEAMKKFNAAVGTELLPVLTRLVPEFAKMIPSLAKAAELLGKLVESAAKDPIGTIFKLIAAKLVLDLTMAGIGAAAKNALAGVISRIPVPGGSAGTTVLGGGAAAGKGGGFLGRPTAAGVLGAAGIGALIGAPVAEAIYAGGVGAFESGEASMKESGQALNQVRALGGQSTRNDFDTARSAIERQQEKVAALAKPDMFADFMGLFGASNRDVEKKTQESMLAEMRASFAKAVEAAQKQNEASAALSAAAEKISGANLNRGNQPAPPVG